jgi:hypothetical protein
MFGPIRAQIRENPDRIAGQGVSYSYLSVRMAVPAMIVIV